MTNDHVRSAMMSPREWRFVRIGALVSIAALAIVFVILPFARNWVAREAQLAAERDRYAHLQSLVSNRFAIDSAALVRENELSALPRRVVRARSRALAAAALQSLLQELAESSNVTVTRLDVAGNASITPVADAASNAPSETGEHLPVSMSAVGDVYGLTAFLGQLRNGPRVVVIDRLAVQSNSALRGAPDVLQMTVSLHAPAIVE